MLRKVKIWLFIIAIGRLLWETLYIHYVWSAKNGVEVDYKCRTYMYTFEDKHTCTKHIVHVQWRVKSMYVHPVHPINFSLEHSNLTVKLLSSSLFISLCFSVSLFLSLSLSLSLSIYLSLYLFFSLFISIPLSLFLSTACLSELYSTTVLMIWCGGLVYSFFFWCS